MVNFDWLILGIDLEKEEVWYEIGGGLIFDSELFDLMDGGRVF